MCGPQVGFHAIAQGERGAALVALLRAVVLMTLMRFTLVTLVRAALLTGA